MAKDDKSSVSVIRHTNEQLEKRARDTGSIETQDFRNPVVVLPRRLNRPEHDLGFALAFGTTSAELSRLHEKQQEFANGKGKPLSPHEQRMISVLSETLMRIIKAERLADREDAAANLSDDKLIEELKAAGLDDDAVSRLLGDGE